MVDRYEWRGRFTNAEFAALHADAFAQEPESSNWEAQLAVHSLGWVCGRRSGQLVGFVNVAWDGSIHAFILDTMVARPLRRQGVGTELIAVAVREAKTAGCQWLHVDFEDGLRPFYFDSCGFRSTRAGLMRLHEK